MTDQLKGSDLTRAMVQRGDQKVWCAVHDESDQQAMTDHDGNNFTAYIVAFKDGVFYCTGDMEWLYAVPIKIKEIMHQDVRW